VSFRAEDLLAALSALENGVRPARYVVALSGGLDSSVLLHALAASRAEHGRSLLAAHVDHGLSPDAPLWAEHCRRFAASLDVEFVAETVAVTERDAGPEAAAREARYAALAEVIAPGDWLLSAHHRDDQAETLLLNLLRGSGPAGVAGIPRLRRFAHGWLARPLLDVGRHALECYARRHGIEWIEDPANDADRYDRNYLRHEVLPVLECRFPNAAARLSRSAALARDAEALLAELAAGDLDLAGGNPVRLDIPAFEQLSRSRRRNLLRHAIRQAGLPPAPGARIDSILDDLVPARPDAEPVVCWPGAEARRFRGRVYLLSACPQPAFDGRRFGSDPVPLGAGLGELVLAPGPGEGLREEVANEDLTLRRRQGGEKIRPSGQSATRSLKNLYQEAAILPWMRESIPLVYAGDRLVAVADLWLAAEAVSARGRPIAWRNRPSLD
jgi:tRNA(Ile)-lysidine synthase